jgi:hypothetical protein
MSPLQLCHTTQRQTPELVVATWRMNLTAAAAALPLAHTCPRSSSKHRLRHT